jgi:glucan phosphoethanolaminetransferase (alkaline phosphatase superfamily)
MTQTPVSPPRDENFTKGKQHFILLLAGILLLALSENFLLYFLSSISRGTLMIPYIYPLEVTLLIFAVMASMVLLLLGFRIRYLFLVIMMVLSISLAFFAVQTFQISYGFGYGVMAGCLLLLGAGFYAFYNPYIVYFLRRNAELRSKPEQVD